VLVLARQSIQSERGSYVERATTLHVYTLDSAGETHAVTEEAKGALVRALVRGVVRRVPEDAPGLVTALRSRERELANDLRRPTEKDWELGVVHAMTPLGAIVVS
jgi:hypothetical protein